MRQSAPEQRQSSARAALMHGSMVSRAPALAKLLIYLCEKTFDGKVHEIREFSIATEVYGRRVAKFYYGAGGFVLHHNTDVWGDAVPIDGARYGIWPMGAAWLSLHLADHYDFTRDRKFLAQRAYPVMKEAAQFFLDYLVPDGKGHLVTGPSLSPENEYKLPSGERAVLTMGPTMDSEILQGSSDG